MKRALLGLWTYLEFAILVALWIPATWFVRLLHRGDPTHRHAGRMMRALGRATSRLCPLWTFEVRGRPPADIGERPYVVVANHESSADPFLLSFLPWDMRWIGKIELTRQPLTGRMFRASGDLFFERGNRASVLRMLGEARRSLDHGISLMMFPEGTRSADGRLLGFKDGAFQLALEAGVPILPVALAGTRQCRPKGSLWFGEARAGVTILEPLSTEGMTLEDLPRLKEAARLQIATAVEALRTSLGIEEEREAPEGAIGATPGE